MADKKDITVENKLLTGKRAINIYHHDTRGAHLLSYNGSVTLPLGTVEKGDYLHISVTRGPGLLKKGCLLDIQWALDFEFAGEGKVFIIYRKNRVIVEVPAGLPVWQLKITRSGEPPTGNSAVCGDDRVTIGEVEKSMTMLP